MMKNVLNKALYAFAGIAVVLALCGLIWVKLAITEGLAHPPQTAQQIR